MAATDTIFCKRLSSVAGFEDRRNDIYVTGNVKTPAQHVLFFGGDIQDYPEKMESHRDNKRYVEWNIEATAAKIAHRFANSAVFVIRPANMIFMRSAVYSNFVEMDDFATPVFSENNNAWEHLIQLYQSALDEVCGKRNHPDPLPVHIVAFSKGCTVLNQLVFELHLLQEIEHLKCFASQLKSFYWLDGGHSGGTENTWVTDDTALKNLATLGFKVFIHVSPYQIRDSMRPWIGKAESTFHHKLKDLKVNVHRTVHFDSEPGSIENHFSILSEF